MTVALVVLPRTLVVLCRSENADYETHADDLLLIDGAGIAYVRLKLSNIKRLIPVHHLVRS